MVAANGIGVWRHLAQEMDYNKPLRRKGAKWEGETFLKVKRKVLEIRKRERR